MLIRQYTNIRMEGVLDADRIEFEQKRARKVSSTICTIGHIGRAAYHRFRAEFARI